MAPTEPEPAPSTLPEPSNIIHTRGYQQELLEESLRSNIIIALDTGSGKTHIAVLRMKHETERNQSKVSWFLAPTVALVEQQREVIKGSIPVPVCMISGASEPNQWKDSKLWRNLLDANRIVVSTPQVLLDALAHAYVKLGSDVGLLVFDEAHHATSKHPYNMIMQQFYLTLPPRSHPEDTDREVRPYILGLTASPIYGGNVDLAFQMLERNLDSTIRSSRLNREELATYVHKPIFRHVLYREEGPNAPCSHNILHLEAVVNAMDIEEDPFVRSLRKQLARTPPGDERRRVDQRLSKTIDKEDTFTHRGLRDFLRAAKDIRQHLGLWAANWYVAEVIQQARRAANPYNNIMSSWRDDEKNYLLKTLDKVKWTSPSNDANYIRSNVSPKLLTLIDTLEEEMGLMMEEEKFSGIVFVTRRDEVIALAEVLTRLPEVQQLFRVGCLLGASSTFKRHSFLDITRQIVKDSHAETLADFRNGEKDLIISTAVAEEGLDIQACGCVIRFDLPSNVVAWAQSRGRARRSRSSFILMFDVDSPEQEMLIHKWEQTEQQMLTLYNDAKRILSDYFEDLLDAEDAALQYVVPSTGAVLTLDSVTSHLNHFCSVLPNASYGGQLAIYELDPPEYAEGWHSQRDLYGGQIPYEGPWGATVLLPRALPKHLREFSTPRTHKRKLTAQKHAAFTAYVALHKAGLLNDYLLPLTSAIEPDKGEEVKKLLSDIEKRAGTERVSIQMDPWAPKTDDEIWWRSEISIKGLPSLHLLTRNPMPKLAPDEAPTLYVPGQGAITTRVRPLGRVKNGPAYIQRARDYTLRILSPLHGAHMKLNDTSFSYLFIPATNSSDGQRWTNWRHWMETRWEQGLSVQWEAAARSNAALLAKQFEYPTDIVLIRPNHKFGKALRFVKWYHGALTPEEEDELLTMYEGFPNICITPPFLQVTEFPKRADFRIPLSSATEGLGDQTPFFILPQFATVELLSHDEVHYAIYLPSLMRSLSNSLTVASLRGELLANTLVAQVPFQLLQTATTAPVSQEMVNYQRLETLGDTVLKYITSIQLFADHPLWHEGYLARRKDHAVSNMQLAKAAIAKEAYKWIIRDRFVPRKWRPRYLADTDVQESSQKDEESGNPTGVKQESQQGDKDKENANATGDRKGKEKDKKNSQELSTKVLADIVESLIGAAYEHGGFDLAVECLSIFGLGLTWKKVSTNIDTALSAIEELENPPLQLRLVENMLGYTFNHKALLVQALTHASYNGELATMSYERLEFLGDCTLDMVVTDFLYHAPGKNYKPGYMHLYKEALVNSHFLAYICMRTNTVIDTPLPSWDQVRGVSVANEAHTIHLWQCLMHSSSRVLDDQNVTASRFEKMNDEIQQALTTHKIYPWAALTSLQAPKFISDMIESLLGAVFIDSRGSLDTVRGVLRTLGIVQFMERIVGDDVDVLHPISRLAIWAGQQDPKREMELKVEKEGGNVSCAVLMDKFEIAKVSQVYRSRASQEEVRFTAAEEAIRKLHVTEEEDNGDDDGWGDDVPEYEW